MEILELVGITTSGGALTLTRTLKKPMRLVKVHWVNVDLASGVDATIKATGSESAASAMGVTAASLDRTLLTLTNANADAWYDVDELVEQQIRLDLTSGGDAKKGGAILYLEENATGLVEFTPAATFYHGQTNVTTAGTEVALAASQALVEGIVTIKAKLTNTGDIFIGKNPVTSSTGFILDAGEQITLTVDNVNDVYIDSSVNGEGVSWLAS